MDFMGFVLHDAISLYHKYYWMVYLRVRKTTLVEYIIYYEHQKEYRPQFLQGTPCLPYWGL
jgi:hypothetical protein